jgi:anthraniloyl-CoA monooxygenase
LIFTEMTCVSRDARITPGCTGLWNDERKRLAAIVDFVHATRRRRFACSWPRRRKGATRLMGGMDRPLEEGGWDVLSASPIPTSRTASAARDGLRCNGRGEAAFVAAAERGERCGFDMLSCIARMAICSRAICC